MSKELTISNLDNKLQKKDIDQIKKMVIYSKNYYFITDILKITSPLIFLGFVALFSLLEMVYPVMISGLAMFFSFACSPLVGNEDQKEIQKRFLIAMNFLKKEDSKKIQEKMNFIEESKIKIKDSILLAKKYELSPRDFCEKHYKHFSLELANYIETHKKEELFFFNSLSEKTEEYKQIKLILNKNKKVRKL